MPSTRNQISILLADDHPIVRKGVRSLLEQEPEIRVVGEAGDGQEAIEKARDLCPDVLVMDISMPGLNGIEATRHISQTFPATRVVALSVHSSGQFIKDMFKAGARGYLLKESAPEELTAAIHAVMRGETFLSSAIAGKVVSGYLNQAEHNPNAAVEEDSRLNGERLPPDNLMRTKFHRPVIPQNHVHRRRLIERMQNARHTPLTLVSAPAGYGKSILVSCWLESNGKSSAWLSLDKDDNDLHRFITYFLAAIRSLFPEAVSGTSALANAFDMPPVNQLCASLIDELEHIEEDYILVLDDVHHLRHKSIFEMINCLLQHPPATMHLVLIGRRDPFLPISRLRATDQITEIRTADLRFTPEETVLLLQRVIEKEVGLSLAAAWTEKTEGWCTGLRLAAMAMRRRGDSRIPENLPDSVQYLLEYLFLEVFLDQPKEIHRWILSAAILDKFCAPLCEAIVGRADGQGDTVMNGWEFIRFLQKENLFLVDLDAEQHWFRFHHLFHQLLKNQLERRKRPEDIRLFHQRAGEWFVENGMIEKAIEHTLNAGKEALAVRLVRQHRHDTYHAGRYKEVEQWLSLFPDDVTDRWAELLLAKSMVYYSHSRFRHIEPLLDRAETLIGDNPEESPLRGEIGFFRGFLLLYQGDGNAGLKCLKNALDTIPTAHHLMVGNALVLFGLGGQMCGRMKQVAPVLSKRYDDPSTAYPCRIRALTGLVWMHLVAGDLEAAALYNRQQQEMAIRRKDVFYLSTSDYVQGMIHFHRYELDGAIRHFAKALDYGYVITMRKSLIDCMVGLVLAYQAKGQGDKAAEALDKLFNFCHAVDDFGHLAVAASCQVRSQLLSTRSGKFASSEPLVEDAPSPVESMFWFLEVPAITRCRKLLADGSEADLREAEKRLRDYLQQNLGQHNHCQAIDIMALLALTVHRQGRADESLEILEKVVRLAEPGGWIRPFVEAGPPMADLLEGLKKKGIAPDFIERLLSVLQECAAISGERGIQPTSVGPPSHPSLVESLTNRERDILELLARRWQNKEIASKLNVSPETVKSHLKNIYQKLDAPNRIQAVEKARRLGLLPEK